MLRLNAPAAIALAIFVGLPAYAILSSVEYNRYIDPEEHWREKVEGARSAVEWSADQVRAREIELQRMEDTRDSITRQETADMEATFQPSEAGAYARENVRMRFEVARGLLADSREDLHQDCQSFRRAAKHLREVTADAPGGGPRSPSPCE